MLKRERKSPSGNTNLKHFTPGVSMTAMFLPIKQSLLPSTLGLFNYLSLGMHWYSVSYGTFLGLRGQPVIFSLTKKYPFPPRLSDTQNARWQFKEQLGGGTFRFHILYFYESGCSFFCAEPSFAVTRKRPKLPRVQ